MDVVGSDFSQAKVQVKVAFVRQQPAANSIIVDSAELTTDGRTSCGRSLTETEKYFFSFDRLERLERSDDAHSCQFRQLVDCYDLMIHGTAATRALHGPGGPAARPGPARSFGPGRAL